MTGVTLSSKHLAPNLIQRLNWLSAAEAHCPFEQSLEWLSAASALRIQCQTNDWVSSHQQTLCRYKRNPVTGLAFGRQRLDDLRPIQPLSVSVQSSDWIGPPEESALMLEAQSSDWIGSQQQAPGSSKRKQVTS